MIRPLFPFYGSKWNIARHYPAPAHDLVIEPFAGSAGYSLFHGVKRAVLVEADPVIAGLWSWLIRARSREILSLPLLLEVGDSVDNYQLEPAARALIGFWLNRGSAQPKLSRTAYSARTDRAQLNWGERARQRVADSLDGIRGWQIVTGDFHAMSSIRLATATWFIDPPYVEKGKFYRVKFDQHHRLGQFAQQARGQVIVCEGPGADWLPFQPLGDFKSSAGRAVERVWIGGQP